MEKEKFSWKKFFKQKGNIKTDWDDLKERAEDWKTCACGELKGIKKEDGSYEFHVVGRPKDLKLQGLGYKFTGAIYKEDLFKAHKIYLKIQARAKKLRG